MLSNGSYQTISAFYLNIRAHSKMKVATETCQRPASTKKRRAWFPKGGKSRRLRSKGEGECRIVVRNQLRRSYFTERNVNHGGTLRGDHHRKGRREERRAQARACIDPAKDAGVLPWVIESNAWARTLVEKGANVATSVTEVMESVG